MAEVERPRRLAKWACLAAVPSRLRFRVAGRRVIFCHGTPLDPHLELGIRGRQRVRGVTGNIIPGIKSKIFLFEAKQNQNIMQVYLNSIQEYFDAHD